MAKWLEFKDFVAKFHDKDGDEHSHTVSAAVVDEDTKGEVVTPVGNVQTQPGDVVVKTERPGVHEVLSADAWKTTGYAKSDSSVADDKTGASADEPAEPNASDHE